MVLSLPAGEDKSYPWSARSIMQLEIRRASLPNAKLAYQIVSEYYEAVNVVARDDEVAFQREYFGPSGAIWLAQAGTEIVGCIALRPIALRKSAEIKRMYVRSGWRGAGVAQKLLNAAEEFAMTNGYEWIYLDTTDKMRAAAHLYQRNGYQPCDRYNDNPQATIFMRKFLRW